ncbi:hypothetical protein WJ977_20305 [Achromobacter xylosoxidans]
MLAGNCSVIVVGDALVQLAVWGPTVCCEKAGVVTHASNKLMKIRGGQRKSEIYFAFILFWRKAAPVD